jgi:uncharacterized protein (TIGR00730 family)
MPTDQPNIAPNAGTFDFDHNPTWRVLRIMSEFVEGFTFLARIRKNVTIFGSARVESTHPYYQQARQLAQQLAERGFTIVTGGGPGIMQAGNQGAVEGNGLSVGLNIQLPMEQRINPYVRQWMSFHYFFSRKVMLDFSAEAYIFFPGGYGTLDELFEVLTLAQTGKIERSVPIILIGTEFWKPLTSWLKNTVLTQEHMIAPGDLALWTLTDDLDLVITTIEKRIDQQMEERLAATGRVTRTADDRLWQATQHMSELEQ